MMRACLALFFTVMAAPVWAQPVEVPQGFEHFGGYIEGDEALYSYRRNQGAEDEQSIVVFRMRYRAMDARLEGQVRELLAVECSSAPQFVDFGTVYRSGCDGEYVAYARVFESRQGVCIVALGLQWAALEAQELPLRQWIDGLEDCAPEEAWGAT